MSDDWHGHIGRLKEQIAELKGQVAELKSTLRLIGSVVDTQRDTLEQRTKDLRESLEQSGGVSQPLFQLPAVLNVLDDPEVGAILVGPDGRYLLFNAVAQEVLGSSLSSNRKGVDDPAYGIFLDDKSSRCEKEQLPWQMCAQGQPTRETMLFVKRADVQDGIWIRTVSIPVFNEEGRSKGAVAFLLDTTEQVNVGDQIVELLATFEQQLGALEKAQSLMLELTAKLDDMQVSAKFSAALPPLAERKTSVVPTEATAPAVASLPPQPVIEKQAEATPVMEAPTEKEPEVEAKVENPAPEVEKTPEIGEQIETPEPQPEVAVVIETKPEPVHPIVEEMGAVVAALESVLDDEFELTDLPDLKETTTAKSEQQLDVVGVDPEESSVLETPVESKTEEQTEESSHSAEVSQQGETVTTHEVAHDSLPTAEAESDATPFSSTGSSESSESSESPVGDLAFAVEPTDETSTAQSVEAETILEESASQEPALQEATDGGQVRAESESGETGRTDFELSAKIESPKKLRRGAKTRTDLPAVRFNPETKSVDPVSWDLASQAARATDAQKLLQDLEAQNGGQSSAESASEPVASGSDSRTDTQEIPAPNLADAPSEAVARIDESVKERSESHQELSSVFHAPPAPAHEAPNAFEALVAAEPVPLPIEAKMTIGNSAAVEEPKEDFIKQLARKNRKLTNCVLVVDDIAVNQKLLSLQLTRFGFNVEVAWNGKEAVDAVVKKDYDIVFMDLDMPVMDGPRATSTIRNIESVTLKHVPIVAMTSYKRDVDRQRCLKSGMDDYLVKGANRKQLMEVINRYVKPVADTDSEMAKLEGQTVAPAEVEPDIANLKHLHGSEEMQEVSRLFYSSVSTFVECLQLAIDEKKADAVTHFAHCIKGPASSLGLTKLTNILEEMIQAADGGDWAHVCFQYMNLRSNYTQVIESLKEMFGTEHLAATTSTTSQ